MLAVTARRFQAIAACRAWLAFREHSPYGAPPSAPARAAGRPMGSEPSTVTLTEIYDRRFSAADRRAKDALWRVLCTDFFQRWVPPDARLVDIGAGLCEFVNHIVAGEKWALDMDPNVARCAAPDLARADGWRRRALRREHAARPCPFARKKENTDQRAAKRTGPPS